MRSARRVAIVGLGSIGRRHLRLLKHLRPDIEVVLVRSGKGAQWPEESLASAVVGSLEQAIAMNVDAAILSSPASCHVPQAITLLRAGVPLLIEKPLSHSIDDVQALKVLCAKAAVPLLLGYVLRHSNSLRCFHEMLFDGCVGEPLFARIECGSYLPDWRPEQDYRSTASARAELGGGVLLELSHEIDYANWFFGPFQRISAVIKNSATLGIDVDDIAELSLCSQSGFPVAIHLDFCRRDAVRCCVLHGSKGVLSWDGIENKVIWKPAVGDIAQRTFDRERDAMFGSQLMHFLKCVEQGEAPKVSLNDGMAVLSLIKSANQSNREGKTIDL